MDTKKLRQKILDLAIRGKLVPQDPNDEPASVLLERIRAEKEQLIKEGKIKRTKKSNASDTSHYENVPFEVPEGWCWTTLGEIGNWQAGATPSRMRKDYYGGTIPWLKTGDLTDGYICEIPETITDKALEETSVKLNPTGSVLIAMYGATIGKIGILTFPATTNQACCACVDYKAVTQKYLFYFLLSYKEEFVKMGGGGAQPNISKEKIISTLIPIPPIAEQNRIADEIERLIKFIETIDLNQDKLEQSIKLCKERILDMASSGKLIPQDQDDEPAIELLRKINPSFTPADNRHYENLPQNWEECALKDIVEIQNGYAFKSSLYSNDGVRVIRITNVQDGYIMDDSPKYYPLSHMDGLEDYMLKGNDLLMSLTGNVGRVAMMPTGLLPAALNQRVCCITPKSSEVCKEFLFYLLRTDSFITSCIESGKGVAQLNVSTEWLKSYRIALPPKDEQRRIVKAIQNIMTKIDKILADL